jgi:hypothetical protein
MLMFWFNIAQVENLRNFHITTAPSSVSRRVSSVSVDRLKGEELIFSREDAFGVGNNVASPWPFQGECREENAYESSSCKAGKD